VAAGPSPRPAPPAGYNRPALLAATAVLVVVGLGGWLFQQAQRRFDERLAAGERPQGGDSLIGSGPFREVVTQREQPEIRVYDRTRDPEPSFLVFQGPGGTHTLAIRPPSASLTLPAGDYDYELRGPQYRHTQRPDQWGRLTCRRFRRYDLDLVIAPVGSYPTNRNLGDE